LETDSAAWLHPPGGSTPVLPRYFSFRSVAQLRAATRKQQYTRNVDFVNKHEKYIIFCIYHCRRARLRAMSLRKSSERRKKARSIGWLAEIYFREGREAAQTALEAVSPGDLLRNCRVVRNGEQALRTNAEQRDRIQYQSFNPPLWGWPYSILRVRFDPAEKEKYMHHGGEEILLPTEGGVSYHFFWTAGDGEPTRKLLPNPVEPGSIIRINPQIPHHTWAAGDVPAEAWMIIRDLTDSTAGTSLDLPADVRLEVHPPRRQLTADDLRQSERYALAAWGISEKIRLGRLRAGLSIRELAGACQTDPAQLSRIENGSSSSNVSLEVLLRIARCLGLEIQRLLSTDSIDERNPFKVEKIDGSCKTEAARSVLCIPDHHLLHLDHWSVSAGETISLNEDQGSSQTHRSWIVLRGEAIFDLADPVAGVTKELVDRDSVIHCRNRIGLTSFRALQDLDLLQVTYSVHCSSGRR
jgi:transcriptional regulator with XRE-family HTH domain